MPTLLRSTLYWLLLSLIGGMLLFVGFNFSENSGTFLEFKYIYYVIPIFFAPMCCYAFITTLIEQGENVARRKWYRLIANIVILILFLLFAAFAVAGELGGVGEIFEDGLFFIVLAVASPFFLTMLLLELVLKSEDEVKARTDHDMFALPLSLKDLIMVILAVIGFYFAFIFVFGLLRGGYNYLFTEPRYMIYYGKQVLLWISIIIGCVLLFKERRNGWFYIVIPILFLAAYNVQSLLKFSRFWMGDGFQLGSFYFINVLLGLLFPLSILFLLWRKKIINTCEISYKEIGNSVLLSLILLIVDGVISNEWNSFF